MAYTYDGTIPAPWLARGVFEFDPTKQGLIAHLVARIIQSDDKQGTLPLIKRESTMPMNQELRRAPGANYQRGQGEVDGSAYECIGYGYERKIPKETAAFFRTIMDAQLNAAKVVKGELLLGREKRVADLLFNATTFASYLTDLHAAPWDAAASDVIGAVGAAVETVRKRTGVKPNALFLGSTQKTNLLTVNTAIRGLLSGLHVATPAMIDQFLADILGLKYVFSGEAVYNSAKEGATISVTDVWNEDYAMVAKVAETDDPQEPCVARIVNWRAMGEGTDVDMGVYYEPQSKSQVVQGDLYEDELIVDAQYGQLLEVDPTS